MEVIVERCAGLDVHLKSLTACVRTPGEGSNRREETRDFDTFTRGLEALRGWLREEGVTKVAMEATGMYWRPVVRHEALSDRGRVKGPPLRGCRSSLLKLGAA